MKRNVNVFIGVVLCAVLCGTFVWLRSAGEEDTWKPNEIYDQVHSSSYSASYTSATFSGSSNDGGVALSMPSSSSMRARSTNFYAGASYAPLASSPLASSPMGAASGAGLYTTSSAEMKSFGGGGNGGAAMGGRSSMSGGSSSMAGGAGVGSLSISSPIAYSTARSGNMGGTSGGADMLAQQGAMPDMASSFGYAAASNYLNAGTYDQYNAMYGGSSTGRSNVRGKQGASPGFNAAWWKWFATWAQEHGSDYYGGDEGYEGYYFNRYSLESVYNEFLASYWNSGMGDPPSFDEWLDWYQSAMAENGYYDYSNKRYYWVPVGDFLPLVLLALLYAVMVFVRRKSVRKLNNSIVQ